MKKEICTTLRVYFLVAVGSFLLALGLSLFLVPMKLSSGGVSSFATILLHIFSVPLSVTTLVINAVLFIIGFKFIGKSALFKTIAGVLFSSFFLEIVRFFPVYTEDIIIATLIGGLLVGLGIGLVVRQEASTGGSDFAALILNRFFPHLSISVLIMLIDCAIITIAGLIFRSVTITFYSGIALFISMKATDLVLSFGDAAKSIFILSPKADEISLQIQNHFARGTTGIYSKGMYTDRDNLMLLSVVRPKELPILIRLVRSIDKNAFIIISDVREVLGEGFNNGTAYDKIITT